MMQTSNPHNSGNSQNAPTTSNLSNHESISNNMISQLSQRLSPLQRIITSQNLFYLPNLYYRKYRLIESLNHERFNFPQQKILIPRERTKWDSVLYEMKERSQLMKEVKKFKVEMRYQIGKNCKEELIKMELKKEEKYLYHRIISNQLGENVVKYFKEQCAVLTSSQGGNENGKASHEQGSEELMGQKDAKMEPERAERRVDDDIFIDKDENNDFNEEDGLDLFNDILNDQNKKVEEKHVQEDESSNLHDGLMNGGIGDLDGDMCMTNAVSRIRSVTLNNQTINIRRLSAYLKDYVGFLAKGNEVGKEQVEQEDNRMVSEEDQERRKMKEQGYMNNDNQINNETGGVPQADSQQQHRVISRKGCFKKINENIRRRLKTKGAEDEQRSLTSATVSLSNLINNYPESSISSSIIAYLTDVSAVPQKPSNAKPSPQYIELSSSTDWLFEENPLLNKIKRKKEEEFELSWASEQVEQFHSLNPKYEFESLKEQPSIREMWFDLQDFGKVFEKNIEKDYLFPKSINSVKPFLSSYEKFNRKVYYFNEFNDREYEEFIMKKNKRKLLNKFERNSTYMFTDNYHGDDLLNQGGNEESMGMHNSHSQESKLSIGKMFLCPINISKISERLIYKIIPGTNRVTTSVKSYNRKNIPISREKMILMSYLATEYLKQFGNNWNVITEFIQIFPGFSNYHITSELVQEFYQLIGKHELKNNSLKDIEIWDKKILPSKMIINDHENYKIVRANGDMRKNQLILNDSTDDSYDHDADLDEHNKAKIKLEEIILNSYENMLKEPLNSTLSSSSNTHKSTSNSGNNKKSNPNATFKKLSRNYTEYGKILCGRTTMQIYNFYENKIRKANKVIDDYKNTYSEVKTHMNEKADNSEEVGKYISEFIKGEVKSGLPFRKKKNINEKNNELVKILQTLRNKSSNVPPSSVKQQNTPGEGSVKPGGNPTGSSKPVVSTSQTNIPGGVSKASDAQSEKESVKKTRPPEKRVGGAVKKKKKDAEDDKK